MDVVVSGSSGLIGSALVRSLAIAGHRPIPLLRPGAPTSAGAATLTWDPTAGTIDAAGLEGVDAVVHLAGVGIAERRWTRAQKQAVLESRVRGTTLLANTLATLQRPPPVLLSASAVGYYGDRGDEVLTEASGPGGGFLAGVCTAWEAATAPAEAAGLRVAHLRTGIVLAREGGTLRKLLPLFRLGLGGRFGSGRQWMSWIALDDHVAAMEHLLRADVAGPVDLTAPNPVTNAELTAVLAHVLHRPAVLPVPRFGPALLYGRQLVDELLYAGQRALPAVLEASGFTFSRPELDGALHALLGRGHG
jgi:uncharacterized protein (TIGR01777 family)